jgi:hypothetical protein
LSALTSVVAGANETLASTETVAGSWMAAEMDGISLETLSAPLTPPESLILISGVGFKPAPVKYNKTMITNATRHDIYDNIQSNKEMKHH